MSDDTKRPTSIADAAIAKTFGVPISSVMVVEISDEDGFWKTTPLRVTAGMARAVAALGLKTGTDWPSNLQPEDPCGELFGACRALAEALEGLKATAARYAEKSGYGEPEANRLAEAWAAQLEALMRSMHYSAKMAHKVAKADQRP
jgi:hypothetical protein